MYVVRFRQNELFLSMSLSLSNVAVLVSVRYLEVGVKRKIARAGGVES